MRPYSVPSCIRAPRIPSPRATRERTPIVAAGIGAPAHQAPPLSVPCSIYSSLNHYEDFGLNHFNLVFSVVVRYNPRVKLGIYLRISSDPNNDEQATARQEEDCRAFCASQSHLIVDVYRDVDISGFKRVVRPEFDRLLRDLATGRLDGFVSYRVERVLRNWRDWVRMEDIREKAGGFCLTLDGNDTRTATGRNQFELFVYMARMESERISERTKRKHLDSARKGLSHTGGHRPFGYERNHAAIREDEAGHIREAVDRVLSGWTFTAVARDWYERGILTTAGKPWTTSNLRAMLGGPHLAGIRLHDGVPYPASWPGIISEDEHRRLLRFRVPVRRGPWHKCLLTGIVTCGQCGEFLERGPGKGDTVAYTCYKRPHKPNACGGVSRQQRLVDAFVRDAVLARIEAGEMRRTDATSTAALEAEAGRIESALSDLADAMFSHRNISQSDYARLHAELSARLAEINTAIVLATSRNQAFDPATVRAVWDTSGVEWRRAMILAFCERIEIFPSGRGARTLAPGTVRITYVDGPE